MRRLDHTQRRITPPPVVAISSHVPMHSEPAAFSRNHIVPHTSVFSDQCDTRDTAPRSLVVSQTEVDSDSRTGRSTAREAERPRGARVRAGRAAGTCPQDTSAYIDIQSSTHHTLPHLTRHTLTRCHAAYSIPLRDQTYLDITSQTTPQIIAHRQNCVPCFHARSFARSIIRAAEDFTTQRPSHLSPPVAAPCITAPLR